MNDDYYNMFYDSNKQNNNSVSNIEINCEPIINNIEEWNYAKLSNDHYNENIVIKCGCKSTLCFPQDFEEIHKYFNFDIPKKYYRLCEYFKDSIKYYKYFPNYCNKCFKKKIEIDLKWQKKYDEKQTYLCYCGKEILIPYKKNSFLWKYNIIIHEEKNYNHLLYVKEFDTYCEINNKLGFNLFMKKRNELEEFVINNNINFKILVNMTAIEILEGLIDLFKKNNKSFPIKNRNYDIFNYLNRNELLDMIIEFKLKIPYYKTLTKDELIDKIINYQSLKK